MKELTIGDIIKYQINKKGISPEKLTEGLCTTTYYEGNDMQTASRKCLHEGRIYS